MGRHQVVQVNMRFTNMLFFIQKVFLIHRVFLPKILICGTSSVEIFEFEIEHRMTLNLQI